MIKENPCNGIEPLPDDSKTRLAFTADEVSKLFKDVWQDEYSYVACIVAGIGGLRISEVKALKPCNIEDCSLEICRSYSRSGEKSQNQDSMQSNAYENNKRVYLLVLKQTSNG